MREWLLGVALSLGLVACAASAPPPTAAAPDTMVLDLEDCLARALAHAPRLQASHAAVEEADAAFAEARARRWPTLGLGAGYQYSSEYMTQTLSFGPGQPSRTLRFGDGHVSDVNLGLSMPLFTGGELARTAQAAAAGDSAAILQAEATRLDVTRDVRQAFFAALGSQAQADAARLAVDRLRRHVDNVTAALEAGAATEEARLRALARASQAEQRRLEATAAGDVAGIELGRLLGQPGTVVRPAGNLDRSLRASQDVVPGRLDDRPDVAGLEREQSRQELLATAARGRLWPRVIGDVRGHYGRPGVNALANDWMSHATVGVSLDWPLWDAGARRQRAEQAAARARRVAAQRSDLSDALAAAHAMAQSRLRAAVAQQEEAARRSDLQRQILELVGRRYAEANATETEYLDAQDDLTQADIDLVLARTGVRLAEAALLWTVGE